MAHPIGRGFAEAAVSVPDLMIPCRARAILSATLHRAYVCDRHSRDHAGYIVRTCRENYFRAIDDDGGSQPEGTAQACVAVLGGRRRFTLRSPALLVHGNQSQHMLVGKMLTLSGYCEDLFLS